MAFLIIRYWESGSRLKSSFVVRFKKKDGKAAIMTFKDEDAAKFFLSEITKKEQRWKAERVLAAMEG